MPALLFLLENVSSFCNAKATHNFQQKYQCIAIFQDAKATHIFAGKISMYLPYFKTENITSR